MANIFAKHRIVITALPKKAVRRCSAHARENEIARPSNIRIPRAKSTGRSKYSFVKTVSVKTNSERRFPGNAFRIKTLVPETKNGRKIKTNTYGHRPAEFHLKRNSRRRSVRAVFSSRDDNVRLDVTVASRETRSERFILRLND